MISLFLLLLLLHFFVEYNSILSLIFFLILFSMVYANLQNGMDPDFMLVYYALECKILIQNLCKVLYFRIISYPAFNFHTSENTYLFILALISINFILLYIIYILFNNTFVKASPYTGLFLSIFISSILLIIFNFLFG